MIPVIVFAKVPLPGIAKTRIAAAAGQDVADRIYHELLIQTARTVAAVPHHVAYTGHTHPQALEHLFPAALSFFPQCDGTLGDRMRDACQRLLIADTCGVIVIGCDVPELSKEDIGEAKRYLSNQVDVVIGPAHDGGYYLIGCTRASLMVFDAQKWSTPELFDETVGIIRQHGLRTEMLRTLSDIDTMEDYNRWRSKSEA